MSPWLSDRLLSLLALAAFPFAAAAIGEPRLVEPEPRLGSFPIVQHAQAATILVDANDWPGVIRAAHDLATDIASVSGVTPTLTNLPAARPAHAIIIGTVGKGGLVDQLVRARKLDVAAVAGQWESSIIQVVRQPGPGIDSALVIAGSDKRAAIFGVYTLSEQIGVSPWHWWADVPPKHRSSLFYTGGRFVQGPPAVKYRGIFINDEGPCLMGWARHRYGDLNHQMYTNVFELILRLKGNALWPAMWDNSFATDDPLNPKLADEYGVVIGTSHHEPMMRAWKEWTRAGHPRGSWDYSRNEPALREYWAEGLRRTKPYEKLITLGMRGDGDEPMSESQSVALLERIVADQRQMIRSLLNTNLEQVPQVWALYKEVQGYYERGMRVPDDVTLLWCDDNWGNLRRLPTATERSRPGGAGIYYHLDYVGGPRNYKWVNTVPLPKIWEQMNLALHYGADRLWIVNVGDIKPEEVPLEFFLTFAWNPKRWSEDSLDEFLRLWAEREFGSPHAPEIADIVAKYAKYNGRRKPELLAPGTFSLDHYEEAKRVLAEWKAIVDQAERIGRDLPKEDQDAYFELVLYPVKACAFVNELYITVARNRVWAARHDPHANDFAARARELFRQDAALAAYYNHTLAGGKWEHMMDQTHIGYTGWQEPRTNNMPDLVEVPVDDSSQSSLPLLSGELPYPVPANPPRFADPHSGIARSMRSYVFHEPSGSGCIAIEAEHFFRKIDTAAAHWQLLPDHGRTLSAMTVFPVDATSLTPPNSPCLEYSIYLTSTGAVTATLVLSPSLNFMPDRGLSIAASFDAAPPQILTVVPKGYNAGDGNRDWEESVKNSARFVSLTNSISTPGAHTFKVWMVDPGVVLQRIQINTGGLLSSYLGPPESPRFARLSRSSDAK